MTCPACGADAVSNFALATSGALSPARCRRCAAEIVVDSSFALQFAVHFALHILFLGSVLLALLWWTVLPVLGWVLLWLAAEVSRLRFGTARVVTPEERRRAPRQAVLVLVLIASAIAIAGIFDR